VVSAGGGAAWNWLDRCRLPAPRRLACSAHFSFGNGRGEPGTTKTPSAPDGLGSDHHAFKNRSG